MENQACVIDLETLFDNQNVTNEPEVLKRFCTKYFAEKEGIKLTLSEENWEDLAEGWFVVFTQKNKIYTIKILSDQERTGREEQCGNSKGLYIFKGKFVADVFCDATLLKKEEVNE